MITRFKEVGSKKLLKELFITGHIPTIKDQVKIGNKYYVVTAVVFDADNISYTLWLRKFQ